MIEINLEGEILSVLDMQISKYFLLAKGKEDLGKLNIRIKMESEKSSLKLNIKKIEVTLMLTGICNKLKVDSKEITF